MTSRLLKTGLIPALATVAFFCSPQTVWANFKYIPNSQSGSGAPASTDTNVTATPLTSVPQSSGLPAQKASQQTGGEIINGFGNQVPLVIALREIVPASYQFAFADGLNLGTLINWKGGKPWRDVLHDVVTPLGLTAIEKNSVIYIDRSDAVIQNMR